MKTKKNKNATVNETSTHRTNKKHRLLKLVAMGSLLAMSVSVVPAGAIPGVGPVSTEPDDYFTEEGRPILKLNWLVLEPGDIVQVGQPTHLNALEYLLPAGNPADEFTHPDKECIFPYDIEVVTPAGFEEPRGLELQTVWEFATEETGVDQYLPEGTPEPLNCFLKVTDKWGTLLEATPVSSEDCNNNEGALPNYQYATTTTGKIAARFDYWFPFDSAAVVQYSTMDYRWNCQWAVAEDKDADCYEGYGVGESIVLSCDQNEYNGSNGCSGDPNDPETWQSYPFPCPASVYYSTVGYYTAKDAHLYCYFSWCLDDDLHLFKITTYTGATVQGENWCQVLFTSIEGRYPSTFTTGSCETDYYEY